MQTFRGLPLPERSTDGQLYVRSGVLELKSGNRFTLKMDTDFCQGEVCEDNQISYDGAYTARNGFFTLETEDGPLNGRYFDDYLTVEDDNPSSVWVLVE